MFITVVYLMASFKNGQAAPRNPWGGSSLEWQAPTPPPLYNFEKPPVVHELYNYDDLVEVEPDVWERRARSMPSPSDAPATRTHTQGRPSVPTVAQADAEGRGVGRADRAARRETLPTSRGRAKPSDGATVPRRAAGAKKRRGQGRAGTRRPRRRPRTRPWPRLAVHPAPLRRRAAPVRLRQARHLAVPRAGGAVLLGAVRRVRPLSVPPPGDLLVRAQVPRREVRRDQHRRPDLLVAHGRVGGARAQLGQRKLPDRVPRDDDRVRVHVPRHQVHRVHAQGSRAHPVRPLLRPVRRARAANELLTKSNKCPGSKGTVDVGTTAPRKADRGLLSRAAKHRSGSARGGHPGRLPGRSRSSRSREPDGKERSPSRPPSRSRTAAPRSRSTTERASSPRRRPSTGKEPRKEARTEVPVLARPAYQPAVCPD